LLLLIAWETINIRIRTITKMIERVHCAIHLQFQRLRCLEGFKGYASPCGNNVYFSDFDCILSAIWITRKHQGDISQGPEWRRRTASFQN
jgi:hypothetical protein